MKKGVEAILLCILLLVSSLVIVSPVEALKVSGNTLYVGGSGPGNYTKIQDAIDNASSGDTVFVYNGTYYENVVINKNISLIGEDKNITIIDGERKDNVIKITNDYVNVSGFTIRNSSHSEFGAGISIYSDYNTISENNITFNHGYGILIPDKPGAEGSFNLITRNIICDNNEFGIYFMGGQYNIISRNLISNNKWGVALLGCSGNKIYENYISHSTREGIFLRSSNRNIINRNSIEYNGIGINITMVLGESGFNVIKNNNLISNSVDATFAILLIPVINTWFHNYWGVPKLFPKIIMGALYYDFDPLHGFGKHIPWVAFDLLPALIPNDIPPLEVS